MNADAVQAYHNSVTTQFIHMNSQVITINLFTFHRHATIPPSNMNTILIKNRF